MGGGQRARWLGNKKGRTVQTRADSPLPTPQTAGLDAQGHGISQKNWAGGTRLQNLGGEG